MRITYLGQCGFLLEDGDLRIVTDPYLSDSVDRNHYSKETPWKRLYPAPVTLGELKPDIVLISHGHDDHMDPDTLCPYRAAGGETPIVIPAPEIYTVDKWGLKGVYPARAENSFKIKHAVITPIPCAHTQLHTDDLGRFYELSYIIDIGNGKRVFFGGDMSLYDGLEKRLREAELSLLLLPANGRDEHRTNLGIIGNVTPEESAKLSAALNVPWIPMHHDLYEINCCGPDEPETESRKAGAKVICLKPMESCEI